MERQLYVNIPEYYEYANKPRNFEDLVSRMEHARQCGIWCVKQLDRLTGEVLVEQWLKNNWSDNGANTMIKAIVNSAAPAAFTPANIIAVDQSHGYTSLTAQIPANTTISNISVAAPTGPAIPSGSKLLVGAGTGTTLLVTLTQTISAAGTVTIQSVTSPASIIPSGANVRFDYSAVSTVDLAALAAPVSYTAPLPSANITFANRQVTVTNSGAFLFSTAGTPPATAANYTAAWLTNANPATATSTVLHVVFDIPLIVNANTNGLVTIVEQL